MKRIVISGASGVGKSTIVNYICQKYDFQVSKSYTTRQKRSDEDNEYEFISKDKYHELNSQDFFFESVKFCDHFYAIPKHSLEKSHILFNINAQGMMKIRQHYPITSIFITASKDIVTKRLQDRGHISRIYSYDDEEQYKYLYDHVITNEDLIETYWQIDQVMCNV